MKPTRERIERLCKTLAPFRILETNIYPTYSRRKVELPPQDRNTRLFDFLLETAHPRLAFVHGKSAVAHLSAMVQQHLQLGDFTRVTYRGVPIDVIAGHHLAYQWSYEKVEVLAQRLRRRLEAS